jgi:hypothetical protein
MKLKTLVNIGKPSFKETTFQHGIKVQLIKISGGFIPLYKYKLSAKNLINMVAVLDDGKEMLPSQQATFKNDDGIGYWELRFPLLQNIDHFDVMVATQVDPFKLNPEYKLVL